MRPTGQRGAGGVGKNILGFSAGTSELKSGAVVALKVDNLRQSCERVRIEGREGIAWSGIVDDFSALSASLRLLRDAIPTNLNALSIVPHDTALDLQTVTAIPDLLSTFPGDVAYEELAALLAAERAAVKDGGRFGDAASGGAASVADAKPLRLRVQAFNRSIDAIKDALQAAATEVQEPPKSWQPLYKLNAAQLRKESEMLSEILTRLYRGTGLCPPPI